MRKTYTGLKPEGFSSSAIRSTEPHLGIHESIAAANSPRKKPSDGVHDVIKNTRLPGISGKPYM